MRAESHSPGACSIVPSDVTRETQIQKEMVKNFNVATAELEAPGMGPSEHRTPSHALEASSAWNVQRSEVANSTLWCRCQALN